MEREHREMLRRQWVHGLPKKHREYVQGLEEELAEVTGIAARWEEETEKQQRRAQRAESQLADVTRERDANYDQLKIANRHERRAVADSERMSLVVADAEAERDEARAELAEVTRENEHLRDMCAVGHPLSCRNAVAERDQALAEIRRLEADEGERADHYREELEAVNATCEDQEAATLEQIARAERLLTERNLYRDALKIAPCVCDNTGRCYRCAALTPPTGGTE